MIPSQLLLLQNGQQIGPFPSDAVREMLTSGTISTEDYAWGDGMADWATLGTLFGSVPVSAPAAAESAASTGSVTHPSAEGSLGSMIKDAFSYPFRGNGLLILILGTILFTALNFVGKFSWYLYIAGWGYLLLMLQQIIHGTAMGEKTLPDWPEFDGFGELAVKFFQWVVTIIVCFLPAILFAIFGPDEDYKIIGVIVLAFAGALYFPMAALGVAMYDTIAALNPMLIVRSIKAVPGHYCLVLVVFSGLVIVKGLTGLLQDIPGFLIPGVVLDQLDALWSACFLARVLGALYYVNRRRLGWF
jgi:hypothetical protein